MSLEDRRGGGCVMPVIFGHFNEFCIARHFQVVQRIQDSVGTMGGPKRSVSQRMRKDSIWRLGVSLHGRVAKIHDTISSNSQWVSVCLFFPFFLIAYPLLISQSSLKWVCQSEESANDVCAKKKQLGIQLLQRCWVPGTKHQVQGLCCVIGFLCH